MKNSFFSSIALTAAAFTVLFFSNCTKEDQSLGGNYDSYFEDSSASGGIADSTHTGNEEYRENDFVKVTDEPVSTFSIDADGGSYAYVRSFLKDNQLPPKGIIRTEELINFFQFDYPEPSGDAPISLNAEIADCPWTPGHKLLRIGIKGERIERADLPACNFVFLIDVSGSMSSSDKLELLKEAFKLFTEDLRPQDRVAIVTYAGDAGVLLESTPGDEKNTIKKAIDKLNSGGSTNGEGGIRKAYDIATANFIAGGNNRVILGTDGDFNVGISDQDELVALIEEKRETGVFLTTLGVGDGNYKDGTLEQLANNGNGTYEYIDDIEQAKKVFQYEFGKFYTVAKDVKIQIAFDPNVVAEYRLIGYENRLLNQEDFEDDTKDAGEIGADQTITALYELVMQPSATLSTPALTIDFRYKKPDADTSIPLTLHVPDTGVSFLNASENMRFAATVAGYGMMLWGSAYTGNLTYDHLLEWGQQAKTFDPHGWRSEFLEWVEKAREL
jgi:Ca-activated chloride channel family protein